MKAKLKPFWPSHPRSISFNRSWAHERWAHSSCMFTKTHECSGTPLPVRVWETASKLSRFFPTIRRVSLIPFTKHSLPRLERCLIIYVYPVRSTTRIMFVFGHQWQTPLPSYLVLPPLFIATMNVMIRGFVVVQRPLIPFLKEPWTSKSKYPAILVCKTFSHWHV